MKKFFIFALLKFSLISAFAQCKQINLATIPENNHSAVALINQADAINTGVFDLLLKKLTQWNISQTTERGIPIKITTEIDKSLKSPAVHLDLCLAGC